MIKVMRAKLHGIHVTECDLNYHGSITLDPTICSKAGILPLEFVQIWNKNSGARISTYVIYGKPESKCCILNGAAARTCQIGDELIICAIAYIASDDELTLSTPKVICFDRDNQISDKFEYKISGSTADGFNFEVTPI